MNCLRAEELLSDYAEGQLHDLLRRELEAHLSACADCPRLLAALDDVLRVLQAARRRWAVREVEPAPDLAARAAAAALAAGRRVARARFPGLPMRVQTVAAAVALLASATVLAGRSVIQQRWPQRMVSEAARAGVHLLERKDRAVEDLRVLRVIVGATFAGRVDRVSERVDDYRRLLERRRSAAPGGAPEGRPGPPAAPGAGAASPRPVSAAEPAHWAARSPAAAIPEPQGRPVRTRRVTGEG